MYTYYTFMIKSVAISYFPYSCFKLFAFFSKRIVLFLINKITSTVGLFSYPFGCVFKADFEISSPVNPIVQIQNIPNQSSCTI